MNLIRLKVLRRNTPTKLFNRLEPLFGASQQPDLVSPTKTTVRLFVLSASNLVQAVLSNESVCTAQLFGRVYPH